MPNCQSIDPFVTPYIDGEIAAADRSLVEEHLRACAPCHSRVAAERAARSVVHARRSALQHEHASPALRDRCVAAGRVAPFAPPPTVFSWRGRLAPIALAASLTLVVGGTFVYRLTDRSATVLAAELTADHVKCFALNQVISTDQDRARVERSLAASFGWEARLPEQPERMGLQLVGARPCLYGEGRVAHIMYRYQGHPVSVFMLPRTVRGQSLVKVLGHECAIWSEGDRTFVVVAREPRNDVQRIASFVQAGMR